MSRSLKKGPFVANSLLEKINFLNLQSSRSIILTWSRSSTILPIMIGHTIAIYNGKEHIPILISDQMIGHKLGEFVPTRNYRGHVKSDKKVKR
uniref:Small ribosomal subunit protein uS19c n=1 Tax=Euglena viridis TaxID=3040 RepID=M1EUR8_EUGVI|nr:ribosomal protein S19 [Euglena viridis]AEY70806.2 ribosomal protein S19 [Euglena viridis]